MSVSADGCDLRAIGAAILKVRHKQIDLPAPEVDSGKKQSIATEGRRLAMRCDRRTEMQQDRGGQGLPGPPAALSGGSRVVTHRYIGSFA